MGDNDNETLLSQDEFATVMQFKSDGNGSFVASDWNKAEDNYVAAISVYEISGYTLATSTGLERETLVALLSNLSMVYLKKGVYPDAERAASRCLELDSGHSKASYRRATARLQMSRKTSRGDLQRIRGAQEDVLRCDQGDATRKLLGRIKAEQKRIENIERQMQQFRMQFSSAVDSGDRAPPMSGGDPCCGTNKDGVVS